jgi:hypothetical protein
VRPIACSAREDIQLIRLRRRNVRTTLEQPALNRLAPGRAEFQAQLEGEAEELRLDVRGIHHAVESGTRR